MKTGELKIAQALGVQPGALISTHFNEYKLGKPRIKKLTRRQVIENLAREYARHAEDPIDGTAFDNAVYDALKDLSKWDEEE